MPLSLYEVSGPKLSHPWDDRGAVCCGYATCLKLRQLECERSCCPRYHGPIGSKDHELLRFRRSKSARQRETGVAKTPNRAVSKSCLRGRLLVILIIAIKTRCCDEHSEAETHRLRYGRLVVNGNCGIPDQWAARGGAGRQLLVLKQTGQRCAIFADGLFSTGGG